MPDGTGLGKFKNHFPDRFFDVGIAEQHAVTFCAGMASRGLKPVFAVYSTFLQRGFDQILHDVAIGNYPVIFGLDRSGLVGADGETHQGIFDIPYLSIIPNMTVMAPINGKELSEMLNIRSIMQKDRPRSNIPEEKQALCMKINLKSYTMEKARYLKKERKL